MKKIIDLQSEKAELIKKMEVITANESLTDELRAEFRGYGDTIKKIDEDIIIVERQDLINKNTLNTTENIAIDIVEPTKDFGETFRDWLKKSVDDGGKGPSFRADPILASTDTTLINKVVAAGIDILQSPAEAFLRQLGVTFYQGLNTTLVLPRLPEDTAAFPGENTGAASANMLPASLVLAPRRITHTQSISKETLVQTNPAIYSSIVQNLINGIWNGVTNDVFDNIELDAPAQVQDAGITYASIATMEASLAYANIGTVKYVTTPANKATLKTTAKMTNQAPIWGDDNTVLGYPAFGVPAANSTQMYMGDFSKAVIGQWGGIEVVVDPYTSAATGLINLTVIGMFDTGVVQPKGIVWKANA
jgi:hypothetical protein